ncbi:uracil-DNA glycosylase family protein [Thioalkalivibrio sp. ALJ16]|uniref:uracil-DNA glycosylase n=1 Tax=Thioalkalivibrio sp. ALJ16 TaxID=1158762 RepID=UPI0003679374|nr:uracil-DNA glycosylase [Thioalkalivibrio sp. ALJ16]
MSLSVRQRRILADMGIPVWRARGPAPGHAGVAAVAANAPAVVEDSAPTPTVSEAVTPGTVEAPPQVAGVPVQALDWEGLEARVRACTACDELARERTRTVFGVGDRGARWLLVGEAPGAEEDRHGEPFVGRAGQLLDNMLQALGLDRSRDVFIANVLKCRPPGNRDPEPEEVRACRGFLDRQIELIQPEVIVALGRIAARELLDSDEPLGRLRGREHRYRGRPLIATFHPAYLLRKPGDKPRAWEDLLRARACLSSP